MTEGKYVREREIGRGGMGAVWLGRDTVLGRRVAMKRVGLVPGGSTPDLERAEREARLAAALNHPHVVAVFDLVAQGDEHWLVMEYVEGASLAQRIRQEGPLDPATAAVVLSQVADALTAAHAAGIVHRDVKPSNILLDDSGHVRLTDFGIARAEADASLTQTGLVTGSPAYLSPEVASGQSATSASDVWALGATLYHALAGRAPYDVGDNVLGALYQIVHEAPPRLDELGWPASLLHHTMATAPGDRWTAARVRDHLRAGAPATAAGAPAAPPDRRDGTVLPVPAAPGERTTALPPATPAAAAPNPIASVPPPSEREGDETARKPSTPTWQVVLASVVILGLVVLGFTLGVLNGRSGDDRAGSTSPTSEQSPTGSPSPSDSPDQDGGEAETPTEQEMRAFVAGYLDTVTSDPRDTWERLTPAFQRKSGGFGRYNGFWRTIEDVTLVDATADPDRMTVTYDVRYDLKRGDQVTDRVTLHLERDGDGFKIADES